MQIHLTSFLVFPLLLAAPCQAATIYQSGVPAASQSPVDAKVSDADNNPFGTWLATRFTIGTGINIENITLEGVFLGGAIPATDSFSVALFSDSGGPAPGVLLTPGLAVTSTRAATGINAGFGPIYQMTLDPNNDVLLDAGTYWIAIADNTTSNLKTQSWYWTASSLTGGTLAESPTSLTGGYSFITDTHTLVYSFVGTVVPEPSAIALAPVVGLTMLLRRRKIAGGL